MVHAARSPAARAPRTLAPLASQQTPAFLDNSPRGAELRTLRQLAETGPAAVAQARRLQGLFGDARGPIQRAIIAASAANGLAAPMDTAHKAVSKQQIEALWLGGRRAALTTLQADLLAARPDVHPRNNRALHGRITDLLAKVAADDPEAGNAGWFARRRFKQAHTAQDETGIVQQPGGAAILPNNPTALQTDALAVRSWQIGDIADSVSWSALGLHLQGRMAHADYTQLGDDILVFRDLKNGTNNQPNASNHQKRVIARASLLRVTNEVRGGLNGLPASPGVSYRAQGVAPGVYGSTVNVGDLVKDLSFWSTSGFKMPHRGANFGAEGTAPAPKAYFIITGATGVYLPRYTNKEAGVHEVLFKNETIFQVNQITNYADRTFFVHVTEVDPATLAPNPVTKNPFTGVNNP